MTCSQCREMYRDDPKRPDCDSPRPEYDGECPRRKRRGVSVASQFLLLARMFMEFKLPPIHGGLLDQDARFITALSVLGEKMQHEQGKKIEEMLREARRRF